MTIIDVAKLDIVFGNRPHAALPLLDQQKTRDEIKDATRQVVGVHDISLSVLRGEIFILMGLSGSGKSTLLRAINGLIPATRGNVFFRATSSGPIYDIANASSATLSKIRSHHMAMVFQNFALLPFRTVAENVAFGLEIARVEKRQIKNRVAEALELVGLRAWSDCFPNQLSGGMQQRVGLARALAIDADVILMDEPFSALDPLIRLRLQQELLHWQSSLKKTIIFVTHDLDEALRLGNRIAIMQDGKIVQIGRPEEVVAHPKTQFVKDFVQEIDQTKILRAKAIMTAMHDLRLGNSDDYVMLDRAYNIRCILDDEGRPRKSLCGDKEGRVIPWAHYQAGNFSENDIVCGHEYLCFKDVVEAVGETKRPIIIHDKQGLMIGAVTALSIVSALNRKFTSRTSC